MNQLKWGWTQKSTMSTQKLKYSHLTDQRQCLKYLNFAKEEGESAIEKKPRPTNTIVDKGWFSLAEFLSSLKINSYVSHFAPQKRRAGFQLKLKSYQIEFKIIYNYI